MLDGKAGSTFLLYSHLLLAKASPTHQSPWTYIFVSYKPAFCTTGMEGNIDYLPPSDDNILVHLLAVYHEDSSLGAGKLLKRVLTDNPQWVGKVSLKRIKKLLRVNNLFCTAPGAPLPYNPPPNNSLQYERDKFGEALVGDFLSFHRSFASGRTLPSNTPNHLVKLLGQTDRNSVFLKYPAQFEDHVLWPRGMFRQGVMLKKAEEKGKRFDNIAYAVLQSGEHEYVEERVVWVGTRPEADMSLEEHALFLMRETGRLTGIGGNTAGVYILYKCLMSYLLTMDVVKEKQVHVSERSLVKQLKNEYNIDILPFSRSVERNPTGRAGRQLAALLLDMIYV